MPSRSSPSLRGLDNHLRVSEEFGSWHGRIQPRARVHEPGPNAPAVLAGLGQRCDDAFELGPGRQLLVEQYRRDQCLVVVVHGEKFMPLSRTSDPLADIGR